MKRILAAMLTALMVLALLPLAAAPAKAAFDIYVSCSASYAYVGETFYWYVYDIEGELEDYEYAFDVYRDGRLVSYDGEWHKEAYRYYTPRSLGRYKVNVRVQSCGEQFSAEINVTANPNKSIKAEPVGATGLKITWNRVPGVSQYYLYRSTSKNTGWTEIMHSVSSPPPAFCIDINLKAGTRYFYKVLYDRPGVMGSFGPVASGVPMAKTGITGITSPAKGQARLVWSKAAGASGYQVLMATSLNGTYKSVRTLNGTIVTFSGLKSGSTLFFRVRPYRRVYTTTYWGQYSPQRAVKVK